MEYYDECTLRRLQRAALEILDAVADVCEKNGIRWFLDSGTALGAVRHQGFIPWDDDVDVGMLREDYDRFLGLAENALPEGYSLHTPENTPHYSPFFAKVYKDGTRFWSKEVIESGCQQGIFVDIFPYDALSDDPSEQARQRRKAARWVQASYLYHSKTLIVPGSGFVGKLQRAGCFCAHYAMRAFVREETIREGFEKARTVSAGVPSDDVVSLAYPYIGPFPREAFERTGEALFEGRSYPVPGDVEHYLTLMYGDTWNELPPESERKNHAPLVLDFGDGKNVCEG